MAVVDNAAPKVLTLEFKDSNGKVWGTFTGEAKVFLAGSTGFYATGKLVNPESGMKYQVSTLITFIGSKPK